jgi:hypothetical protein
LLFAIKSIIEKNKQTKTKTIVHTIVTATATEPLVHQQRTTYSDLSGKQPFGLLCGCGIRLRRSIRHHCPSEKIDAVPSTATSLSRQQVSFNGNKPLLALFPACTETRRFCTHSISPPVEAIDQSKKPIVPLSQFGFAFALTSEFPFGRILIDALCTCTHAFACTFPDGNRIPILVKRSRSHSSFGNTILISLSDSVSQSNPKSSQAKFSHLHRVKSSQTLVAFSLQSLLR